MVEVSQYLGHKDSENGKILWQTGISSLRWVTHLWLEKNLPYQKRVWRFKIHYSQCLIDLGKGLS